MKVKELKKTVNVSWSPAEHYPVMLAAGSAAQQIDATFTSTSQLELYSLNLGEPGQDLKLECSLQTQHKFHKLAWSGAGIIVGGCDSGLLEFYSYDKLMNNSTEALVASSTKHNGTVTTLDINPYQNNLLASGASESEIFIWDLNNTAQPMAPGNRSQPYDQVQAVAWNRQVQHILGSTFGSRCAVWDLRKNEPIMKLSEASRARWRCLAWHPAVPTQLCLAADDDHNPAIQLWDLRMASTALSSLATQSGVRALAWSAADPRLLLSAGRDARLLAWMLADQAEGPAEATELATVGEFIEDVSLSPRDPALIAVAASPHAAVLALLAVETQNTPSAQSQSALLDSFGGGLGALPQLAARPPPRALPPRPPAWLLRPARASFAFGGKLVTFGKNEDPTAPKEVYISQVVSDPEIIEKAAELDAVLSATLSQDPQAMETLAEYCRAKGDAATDQSERFAWFFLRANFMHSFRSEVLNLIGYKQDDTSSKLKSAATGEPAANNVAALSRGESTETEAELSTDTSTDLSDAHTLIEKKLSNIDLNTTAKDVVIPTGDDPTSEICRALISGRVEDAVQLCLDADRISDALLLASLGGPELAARAQQWHVRRSGGPVALLGAALLGRWAPLQAAVRPACWRPLLAAHLHHADDDALRRCCEVLGEKLSAEKSSELSQAALLVYLAAPCADRAARAWRGLGQGARPGQAQEAGQGKKAEADELVRDAEIALLLRAAANIRGTPVASGGCVEALVARLCAALAGQGALDSARAFLPLCTHPDLQALLPPDAPAQPAQQQQRVRTTSSHSRRGHYDDNQYNNVPTSTYDQSWTQPPRPSSQGSHTGGFISRTKYKVDPSVQAAPLYNNYNFSSPISNQPQSQFGYNSPLPDQYSAASVPTPNYGQNAMKNVPPPMVPGPLNPMVPGPLNPMVPGPLNPTVPGPLNPMVPGPLNPMAPGPINPMAPPAPVNPMAPAARNSTLNGGYYSPQQANIEPAAAAKPAAPGWNDPPMLTSKTKPKQEVQAQAPITHPLFGVEPPQHVPLNPYPGQQQQFPGQQQQYPGQQQQYPGQQQQFSGQQQQYPGQQQQYPGQQQQFSGQQQQYPGQQQQYPGQPQQFPGQTQTYPGQMPGYPGQFDSQPGINQNNQRISPAVAAEPPAPVEKAPLPEQLQPLQHTLDALLAACEQRAHQPQVKRKLEDVHRRLDTMYDLLRDDKLSSAAAAALAAAAAAGRAGHYSRAGAAAADLAAGPDFAAVAAFMPGLKVLFQLCEALQVTL